MAAPWPVLGNPPRIFSGTNFARVFEPGPDGRPSGVAVDLISEVAAQLGFTPEFHQLPWLRAQAEVEHGLADVLVGPYRTPEREKHFVFDGPPFYVDDMLFVVPRQSTLSWSGDFREVRNWHIGVLDGWTYGARWEAMRGALSLDASTDLETALRKLLAGRIQVLLTNWRNTEPVLERLGMRGQVHTLAPSVDRLSGYFAFCRDKPDLPFRHAVARQLNEMARSGRIAAINARYGLSYP